MPGAGGVGELPVNAQAVAVLVQPGPQPGPRPDQGLVGNLHTSLAAGEQPCSQEGGEHVFAGRAQVVHLVHGNVSAGVLGAVSRGAFPDGDQAEEQLLRCGLLVGVQRGVEFSAVRARACAMPPAAS